MLLQGDCLDILPTLADASVDLILADLPYGVTSCAWDAVIPFEPMWREFNRIAKRNAAMVFTATQPFTSALVMSNPKSFRYCLVYEKTMATGFLNAKRMPLRAHEDIVVFCRSLPTYNPEKTQGPRKSFSQRPTMAACYGKSVATVIPAYDSDTRFPRSVIKIPTETQSKSVHPTQKPVALLRYLIRTYSNPGHVILDPTMGSGSAGVAAKLEDRSFIGIERDDAYFATAERRIAEAK